MAIRRQTITVSGATGGAGVAEASAVGEQVVNGIVRSLHFAYADSPPATTDVTITETGPGQKKTIFTLTDHNSDGWFYPLAQACNQAGMAITNQGAPIVMADYPTATIAQANNGDGVVVTIEWEEV
jgi:hypothetical protein